MIITDSLGAPRKDTDIISYKDTWPWIISDFMLKTNDYYNFIYSQKALDTKELCRLLNMNLDLYDNEYIFLQVGIVDCARRVFSEKTIRLINMIPGIRSLIRVFAQKYHFQLTRLYKITYTTPKHFNSNIEFFLSRFKDSKKVIIIPIVPAGITQSKKSYKIHEQIELFNSILKNVSLKFHNAHFLEDCYNDFLPINENNYTSDGYHINKNGHLIISNAIVKNLSYLD